MNADKILEKQTYIAVDLGAGSGRVFLVGFDEGGPTLEEVHRFQYPPREVDGHLRWDLASILSYITTGLNAAVRIAADSGREVISIGVDSWGVDHGLIGADGAVMADPVCYRDHRTQGVPQKVFAVLPRKSIFEKTGIQTLEFNTIFQLYVDEMAATADVMLLLPDLITYCLTGSRQAEFTNATTTQMVNAGTRTWDAGIVESLDLPAQILPPIVEPGTMIGKPNRIEGLDDAVREINVVTVGSHDTASAVAGAPLDGTTAYISSGTWSLVGIESDKPFINAPAERENFTNEGGVYGTTRFLKNVMGLWIFESCRRAWKAAGVDVEYDGLLAEIAAMTGFGPLIFPDDERFLNPPNMLDAISAQLSETGQAMPGSRAAVCKTIFDSLAFRYASVLNTIRSITGRNIVRVEILGGGGRNGYLSQVTADACGLRVRTGLVEATVVGNALVQAVTAGRFGSLADGRQYVEEHWDFTNFEPRISDDLKDAAERYRAIESRYLRGTVAAG